PCCVARALIHQKQGGTMVARTYCGIHAFILGCVAALAMAGAAASDKTAQGVKRDAQQAETATRDERAQAKDAMKDIGDDAAKAADRVADSAAEAGEELAERASAIKESVDVKTALMADPSVDATRIDVDADYRTRTITLNGYVPTNTERDMAEVIAKGHAEGWKVVNNISVQPRGQ
ncbi:MAG: BON domain-containing protein, partial [Vicinamibacterales bacterium]